MSFDRSIALVILASADEKFWAIYDPINNIYLLACFDVMCPAMLLAMDSHGNQYQLNVRQYAGQINSNSASDIKIQTKKL